MKLELTNDQALVLFEWLSRWDEADTVSCEHEAERKVLWVVHGQLEKTLTEPFRPDYRSLLEKARSNLSSSPEN